MMVNAIKCWYCDECREVYRYEDVAEECCSESDLAREKD